MLGIGHRSGYEPHNRTHHHLDRRTIDILNECLLCTPLMPGPCYLEGNIVDLHVIDEEDLPFLQALVNDPEVWSWLNHLGPVTMEAEESWYDEIAHASDQEHLIVCVGNEAVGIIGMSDIDADWGVAEIGYFIDPDARENGYASAAVGLLTEYAFETRRLMKLQAYVLEKNEPSQRVLEKNEYECEGRLRKQAFRCGRREDVLVYGRLAGA